MCTVDSLFWGFVEEDAKRPCWVAPLKLLKQSLIADPTAE